MKRLKLLRCDCFHPHVQEASFRLQISMNWEQLSARRTKNLPDFDHTNLLDVAAFLWHFGGVDRALTSMCLGLRSWISKYSLGRILAIALCGRR